MRIPYAVWFAVLLTLIIRLLFIAGNTAALTPEAYEQLTFAKNVQNTGIPMFHRSLSWQTVNILSPFILSYLIAIVSLFMSSSLAGIIITNIAMSFIPLLVYLLSSLMTGNNKPLVIASLASVFAPLIYNNTLFSISDASLGIPLLLLTYYYFIRTNKTAKVQNMLIVSLILLTFTSRLSLVLIPSMLLSIAIRKNVSNGMVETAVFSSFFIIWAYRIFFQSSLISGIRVIDNPMPWATAITYLGAIPLLGGSYGLVIFLRKHTNTAANSIIALGISTAAFIFLGLISIKTGILLMSIILIILSSGAINKYYSAYKRARIKPLYLTGAIIILLLFTFSTIIPSFTLGISSYGDTVPYDDNKVLDFINGIPSSGVHWNTDMGFAIEYYGHKPSLMPRPDLFPDMTSVSYDISESLHSPSPVTLIETLNKYNIQYLVLSKNHTAAITPGCFKLLFNDTKEVYQITCVVK